MKFRVFKFSKLSNKNRVKCAFRTESSKLKRLEIHNFARNIKRRYSKRGAEPLRPAYFVNLFHESDSHIFYFFNLFLFFYIILNLKKAKSGAVPDATAWICWTGNYIHFLIIVKVLIDYLSFVLRENY